MPRRHSDIHQLQNTRDMPDHITGQATGLIECEVVSLRPNGRVDARAIGRRSIQVSARYPLWYEPQLGDIVLVAELQGDERQRVVICPMSTKAGGKPKIKSG